VLSRRRQTSICALNVMKRGCSTDVGITQVAVVGEDA